MSSQRFLGKVAIVSGGVVGIGRTISQRLCAEGASVVIADIDEQRGTAVAKDLQSAGYRSVFVPFDLGKAEECPRIVEAALQHFGRVDILVNGAATKGMVKPLLETPPSDWEAVFRVNVVGTFALTQACVRQMLAQGSGGAVVNLLAIQASSPLPKHSVYASSKGALATMTHAFAVEFANKGIRVNGVAIGPVYTEAASLVLESKPVEDVSGVDVPEEVDRAAATLVGKIGRPEEIASIVCFLASEEASFIAGAVIPADGGRMISRKADPFVAAFTEQKEST